MLDRIAYCRLGWFKNIHSLYERCDLRIVVIISSLRCSSPVHRSVKSNYHLLRRGQISNNMLYPFGSKYLTPTKDFRRLSILLSIYNSPHASQHKIGKENDLSSSMVNNYIKCFKEEGIINVTGSTNRNQRYYLTQAGYSELMRSFLSYSAEIVQIYGAVKREISKILRRYLKEGIQTIVLFGAAETAEVVYAAVKQTSLSVIGIVDSDPLKQGKRFDARRRS